MTTTASRKLTRDDAIVELWARITNCVPQCGDCARHAPDFFTSRDAAAELLDWLAQNGPDLIYRFHRHLCTVLGLKQQLTLASDWSGAPLLTVQRATPEQITLAACKALSIEVE